MADLVVVSNRGPRTFALHDGEPVDIGSAGGLASTLRGILAGSGATWVVAAMSDADRKAAAEGHMDGDGIRVVAVEPEPDQYRMAYDVVSNSTLWFCHHHLFDLPRRPRFDRRWHEAWLAYRDCNALFAKTVAAEASQGATVIVHDYHLALLGRLLAEERPDLCTVHFSHTPFADAEMLGVLPNAAASELLEGMAGFGACGFHTQRWEAGFRGAYRDATPPTTFVAPLGPDPEFLLAESRKEEVNAARAHWKQTVGNQSVIVRVDRIELSKNILRGFWAYEELLDTRPNWRGKVVLLALLYASRRGVAEYLAYRSEIEHTVARINARFETKDWNPIVLDVADDRSRSVAALSMSDVLLVNPVRDGLNLVAKEGPLVNGVNGVLVLSSEAGAAAELHQDALIVNPFDISETAGALDTALSMDADERAKRANRLRSVIAGRTAMQWWEDVLSQAQPTTEAN